jgi:hypothetical protein
MVIIYLQETHLYLRFLFNAMLHLFLLYV